MSKKIPGQSDNGSSTVSASESAPGEPARAAFPVLCIFVGMDHIGSIEIFFEAWPADSGIAIVLCPHDNEEQISWDPQCLTETNAVQVVELDSASAAITIKPGVVYTCLLYTSDAADE